MSKNIGPFLRYNRAWFSLNQESLLRLLNGRFTRGIARMLMRIRPYDVPLRDAICQITPNSFSYGLRPVGDRWQITTDFRTHPKYAKRVYFAMRPFLALAHAFDMKIANPFRPAWNLGWDTTDTFYPNADAETTSFDGYVYNVNANWTTCRTASSGGGSGDNDTTAMVQGVYIAPNYIIRRLFFLFDTSSLDDAASISAGVFSWYKATGGINSSTNPADLALVASTPASDTAIGNDDYDQVGSTRFATDYDIDTF